MGKGLGNIDVKTCAGRVGVADHGDVHCVPRMEGGGEAPGWQALGGRIAAANRRKGRGVNLMW